MSLIDLTILPRISCRAVHDLASLITLSNLRALSAYIPEPIESF